MSVVNWNMQGSSHQLENKWNEGVALMMGPSGRLADVCLLQECGGVPASAKLEVHNFGVPLLDLYQWNRYWIAFYPADPAGNRCNMALVSKERPSTGYVTLPAGAPTWRPAIGVQLARAAFGSIHAISPGGPDAPGLLSAIAATIKAPWVVGGDFNREPATLQGVGPWVPCVPNAPTYPSTHPRVALDYVALPQGSAPCVGEVLGLLMSDHYPVYWSSL